jgi:4-hydroxybenzoate polyprenyltransferase
VASLSALVRLGRFRFLAGGIVLYGLGTVLAARTRPLNLMAYAIGQCAITTTQLMTHYANDYFDLRADRANPTPTKWSGGSRVLADGELSPRVAWNATLLLAAVSLVLDTWILLGVHVSPGTPLLLFVVLILSFEYSGPPLCLHARSLGPLTAALVVGALTPLAGFGMQGGAWSRESLLAVVPTMLAQFAMILVLDFPDAVGDAKAGHGGDLRVRAAIGVGGPAHPHGGRARADGARRHLAWLDTPSGDLEAGRRVRAARMARSAVVLACLVGRSRRRARNNRWAVTERGVRRRLRVKAVEGPQGQVWKIGRASGLALAGSAGLTRHADVHRGLLTLAAIVVCTRLLGLDIGF